MLGNFRSDIWELQTQAHHTPLVLKAGLNKPRYLMGGNANRSGPGQRTRLDLDGDLWTSHRAF